MLEGESHEITPTIYGDKIASGWDLKRVCWKIFFFFYSLLGPFFWMETIAFFQLFLTIIFYDLLLKSRSTLFSHQFYT